MLTNECTLISCPEILTMDEGKPTAEAVCISEGKILAVGTLEELRALAPRHRRKEIHLEEGVLLPGFIDSHSHLSMYAQCRTQFFCDTATEPSATCCPPFARTPPRRPTRNGS